jgi:uracil-DNA glycosylase
VTIRDALLDAAPSRDCGLCPRLAEYREQNRRDYPEFVNAPVASLGDRDAELLIVGLAPGLRGANRTGRPFTGDFAGDLLYASLLRFGFATGAYERRPDDSLRLLRCAISNAVRCAPPQNKPTPAEIAACRPFLTATIAALPRLRAILSLGRIAHDSVLKSLGLRLAATPFAHGARHDLGRLALFDSYHCSRYNTNTGVLTPEMFQAVIADIRTWLD